MKKNEELVFTGVMNKIRMQVEELSNWFEIEFKVIYASEKWTCFQHKVLNRLSIFHSLEREYDSAIEEIQTPDFIYIRKVEADNSFLRFIKTLRERFPSAKIIIEIPTYPYEKDAYNKFYLKINLLKDKIYRNKYKDYIDRFVTFTDDDEIFGVPTIKTMNGIDVMAQKIIGEKHEKYEKSLTLIFVGMMQRQHGLERVIKGLKDYYYKSPDLKVFCLFVGNGPEYSKYKDLASKFCVDKYIRFFGTCTGEKLDEIYDCADVAIAPLGCYKTLACGTRSSALKTREYLSRGLPIITGCVEDVIEKFPCDFHIGFENNDSAIRIEEICDWYQSLMEKYESREKLALLIRDYAYKHVDNSSTMKPIVEYICFKNDGIACLNSFNIH